MASNTIKVVIDVVADKGAAALKNLKSDLAGAEGAFGKMKVAGGAAMDSLKSNVAGMAVAAGTALVAFGVKAVGAFQDLALEADRFSDVAGIAVEDASKWIEVAGDIGVSGEAVQGAFQKMNKAIADGKLNEFAADIVRAKDGTVDANASFQNLVTKIGAIKDPTERAAAAQKAFGKGYAEIAELMEMSATDLQGALKGVSDSKIIDEKEVAKAKEFRAKMDELKDKMEDFTLAVGEGVVPVLLDMVDVIEDVAGPISDAIAAARPLWSFIEDAFGHGGDLIDEYADKTKNLADIWAGEFSDAANGGEFAVAALTESADELASSLRSRGIPGIDDTAAALEGLKRSYDEMFDSDPERDAIALAEGFEALRQKVFETDLVMMDSKRTAEEQRAALRETRLSILDQRDAVVSYVTEVLKIPKSAATNVVALLDMGQVEAAERALAILTRNRTVSVQIESRGGPGYSKDKWFASGGPIPGAKGEPVPITAHGGEFMLSANVVDAIKQGRPTSGLSMGGGAGGGTTAGGGGMNITINMPPGSNGQDVVNAIKKYERTAGPGWRS
jgi:hypothetical protein